LLLHPAFADSIADILLLLVSLLLQTSPLPLLTKIFVSSLYIDPAVANVIVALLATGS
jgi:hypothetical protein